MEAVQGGAVSVADQAVEAGTQVFDALVSSAAGAAVDSLAVGLVDAAFELAGGASLSAGTDTNGDGVIDERDAGSSGGASPTADLVGTALQVGLDLALPPHTVPMGTILGFLARNAA
ncbi:MAG: hypothetical protein K1X79_01735 [Oligoflexia bacterium]|nr:hypothetical protein [Oligoflexia bacterium]